MSASDRSGDRSSVFDFLSPQHLRGLPRVFIPGAPDNGKIELPDEEVKKLRKVLRLSTGDPIAILPNDGRLLVCMLDGHRAEVKSIHSPDSEAPMKLTLIQAMPKGDKLDEVVRCCTELGVAEFVVFPSERSVVRWDRQKLEGRLARLSTIAREACEVAFRTIIPTIHYLDSLDAVFDRYPQAIVLSESESVKGTLPKNLDVASLVVGPEGGWSAREHQLIGDRGVTLGPRVLRVEHAGPAAVAVLLLG